MSNQRRIAVSKTSLLALVVFASAMIGGTVRADESTITVKSNEKIAFLGDSITAFGAANPAGYVNLVIAGLKANDVKAIPIGAGISGHTSKDMLARVDRDVISKKSDWMTLSCGVNDVWHGANGVALDQYKINITSIIDKAQAAGIKVVVLTSTFISEDPAAPYNKTLAGYNDFLKSIAAEKKCPLVDLNVAEEDQIKALGPNVQHGNQITVDGVHMNLIGQQMMATGVLKGFGFNDAQLAKAKEAWAKMEGAVDMGRMSISVDDYNKLNDLANKRKTTVSALLAEQLKKAVADMVAAGK